MAAAAWFEAGLAWTWQVLAASAGGLLQNVALLVGIILPLMVGIELLREANWIDRIARASEPFVRWLGLTGQATFPLVSGIVFGLAYGAGIILESAREGGITRRDARLLCVFLVACHAAIEDTLLFVPFGVNPVALLGCRVLLAVLLTAAAARWMSFSERRRGQ